MLEAVTMMRRNAFLAFCGVVVSRTVELLSALSVASKRPHAIRPNIVAQKLAEEVASKHAEIKTVEIALQSSNKCSTIADTELEGVGEKCDHDELEAMRTGEPFVDKEGEGFDVTMPLHDSAGKIIGTVGLDFKAEVGQQKSGVFERAKKITQELETQVPSEARLLAPDE